MVMCTNQSMHSSEAVGSGYDSSAGSWEGGGEGRGGGRGRGGGGEGRGLTLNFVSSLS